VAATQYYFFDVAGRPLVITNHFRNFNLVSIGQSRFKYLTILFEIVLIVLIPIGEVRYTSTFFIPHEFFFKFSAFSPAINRAASGVTFNSLSELDIFSVD
jgi:hypothetical protein